MKGDQMNTASRAILRWDVSNIYPSLDSPEFDDAVANLVAQLDKLELYVSDRNIGKGMDVPDDAAILSETINGYLDRINVIRKQYRSLMAFVSSFTTTDSYNTMAKKAHSELQLLGVRMYQVEVRFQGWIGTIGKMPALLDVTITSDREVAAHTFYLREIADQSRFLMSETEESLASDLSLSGSESWTKLQRVVSSQLKAHFDVEGEPEVLPISIIQNYYNQADRSMRRQAYEVELSAWESVAEPMAACLNGIKGEVNTLNRRRGRPNALHAALEKARIDDETLEAMLGAMRQSFPQFRRYWHSKAEKLGVERLAWWDLFAPVGNSSYAFTYEEAAEFILEAFGTFSESLVELTRHAFELRWIDAEPRDGKAGGAFCMSIPSVEESRILCNFDGSLDQVATIAHELGHAYHNFCLSGKTQLQRRVPMTLAETASIFNQTIVTDSMLSQSTSAGEELAILESFLISSSQVIVDITSRFLFESEIFKRREEAELSADEFCEIMLRCQRDTYGDGLDDRYLHPYMWARKPHYYSSALSFYNFPYAFGLLFGLGLYHIYSQGDPGFLGSYNQLLRDSGENTPAELALRFGIDIRKPEFWENSLKVVEARINRYEELGE
jgi:pepF/M3 family oligoendopeptidase